MQKRHTVRRAVLVALVPACLLAQPFFFRKDVPIDQLGYSYNGFGTADFNGDGRQDLAVTTLRGYLVVLLNKGGGNFGRAIWNESGPGPGVGGDFNGDGRDDWAAGGKILLGRGDGTFLAPRPLGILAGFTAHPMAAGDFNGDAKLDLLVEEYILPKRYSLGEFPEEHGFRVWLGNGDGTFQSGTKGLSHNK